MRRRTLRWIAVALIVVGLGLTTTFILAAGPDLVWEMLRRAGWWIALVAAAHLVYVLVIALGWRAVLCGSGTCPRIRDVFRYRWIGNAAQSVLPVAEIAGDVLRAWLLARRTGIGGSASAAAIIVELTVRLGALILFLGAGISVLAFRGGGSATAIVGAAAALLGLVVFLYLAQRKGLLLRLSRELEKRAVAERWVRFAGSLGDLDRELQTIYARGGTLARATAWHFLAFWVGAGEIWLLLVAIDRLVGPLDVTILESVAQAGINAGFFMPAGLGAQEGAYVLGARLVGLAAAVGVAVSLLKRARDVLAGLPALATLFLVDLRSRETRDEVKEIMGPPVP